MAKTKTSTTSGGAQKVPWQIVFFQRHRDEDPGRAIPGRTYLKETCPEAVRVRMMRVLVAVRDAPPRSFSGGGYWEIMHDDMAGYYEVRVDSDGQHYRLFCLLESDDAAKKLGAPSLVVITGAVKPFRTTFTKREYAAVRRLGDEYLGRTPRPFAP